MFWSICREHGSGAARKVIFGVPLVWGSGLVLANPKTEKREECKMSSNSASVDNQKLPLSWENVSVANDNGVVVTRQSHNRLVALVENTTQPAQDAEAQRYSVATKWLVDPEGATFTPSPAESIDAARSAILAFSAARLGLAPGAQLVDLNNEFRDKLDRRGARRLAAFPPTAATAYLRHQHAGDVFLVRNGQLESPPDLPLDIPVDGVAWLNRTEWRFDVFSARKRLGGFSSDCRSGRVRRCIDLGMGLLQSDGGHATVRVFNPQHGLVPVANLTARPLSSNTAELGAIRKVGQ